MNKILLFFIFILAVNSNTIFAFFCGYMLHSNNIELGSIADYISIFVSTVAAFVVALDYIEQRRANRLALVDNYCGNIITAILECQSKYHNCLGAYYQDILSHFLQCGKSLDESGDNVSPKECQLVLMRYYGDMTYGNQTGYQMLFYHLEHSFAHLGNTNISKQDKKRYKQELFNSILPESVVIFILYLMQRRRDKELQSIIQEDYFEDALNVILIHDNGALLVEVLKRATSEKMFVIDNITSFDIELDTCKGETFWQSLDKVRNNEKKTNGKPQNI